MKEPIGNFLKHVTGQESETLVVNILDQLTHENIQDVLMGIFLSEPLRYNFLKDADVHLAEGHLKIQHYSPVLITNFRSHDAEKHIETLISQYYGQSVHAETVLNVALTPERKELDVSKELHAARQDSQVSAEHRVEAPKMVMPSRKAPLEEPAKGQKKSQDENVIFGKAIKEPSVRIKELDDNAGICVIDGEVFKTDEKKLRNGKTLLVLYVTDLSSSIAVKVFLKEGEELPLRITELFRRIPKLWIRRKLQGSSQYMAWKPM